VDGKALRATVENDPTAGAASSIMLEVPSGATRTASIH
jgi:hypothetical protein